MGIKKRKKRLSKESFGIYFILPYFIVFAVFGVYSIVYTFYLSFNKWDGIMPIAKVGLNNFKRLLQDKYFYLTLYNTIRIWIFNYIPQICTALLLSCIFTFNRIKGMKFFRAAFYLPNLITAASVGLLFNLFFNGDNSIVNYILIELDVIHEPISFFLSEVFTSSIVSYIQWWMWYGYTTVIVMAGMTTVDQNLCEAAMVDGATKFRVFRYITMPLIRPTIIYLTITSIIGGMQLFDVPSTLTNANGDPQKSILTTTMYIYNQGFKSFNYGYASAISVGLFFIIAILSVIAFRLMKGKDNTYEN